VVLPGRDFTLDVHSIIFGKTSPSRLEPTTFYGNMRNFYFNGELLFDHMTSDVIIPPWTPAPVPTYEFPGYSWIMYDLDLMPSTYLRRNDRETFEVIFRTDRPDGLIWFTGNEQNNMYLTLKVRLPDSSNY